MAKSKWIFIFAFVAVVAALIYRREVYTVVVDIRPFTEDGKIELAEANAVVAAEPLWFKVEPGNTRLARKTYHFKLHLGEQTHTGLIAINDATPIVLK